MRKQAIIMFHMPPLEIIYVSVYVTPYCTIILMLKLTTTCL
jgi:hypothetical protein